MKRVFKKEDNKKNDKNNLKAEQIKKNNKKVISLAASYDADIGDYDEIINNCLCEKRINSENGRYSEFAEKRNRNIAITGSYGSGKSSIVNTFFAKHREYNFINVSMGLYSSTSDNPERDVYTYILKQILYYVRPNDLPYSKFNRRDKSKKSYYLFNTMISLSLIYLILIFFNMFPIGGGYKIIIVSIVLFIDIMYFLQKINIKKISLDKANIEFGENRYSDLNENIEELIHFFLSTKYTIVVFEDLDRQGDFLDIIKTLSLVNYTINNSIHDSKKTIQFIYPIGEEKIKDMEERTKFFDAIIPIKPYVNIFNTKNRIIKLLEDNGIEKNKISIEWVKNASNYVNSPRLVFDFVNQYSIYYNDGLDFESRQELFYLILYKISYPDRFYKFLNGKNQLAVYNSENFKLHVERITGQKWNDISNEDKIKLLHEYKLDFEDELNNLEKEIIKSNISCKNSERLFINRNSNYDNVDIEDEKLLRKIKNNESIIDYRFKSVTNALENLDASDFQKDSILNVQLLRKANNDQEKMGQFLNNLNTKKLEFIVENEPKLNILKLYKSNTTNSKFWAVCALDTNNSIKSDIKDKLLFYTVKYCDIAYITEKDGVILKYLTNVESYLKLFDENYDEIKDKFNELNYKLSDDIQLSKYKSSLTYDLFAGEKCNINSNNLGYFNRELKLKINKNRLLPSIRLIEDNKITNVLNKNIKAVLDYYLPISTKQMFNFEDLLWFFENWNVTDEDINALIDKWNGIASNIGLFIDNGLGIEKIVSTNKYSVNYNNLLAIYHYNLQLLIDNKENIAPHVELISDLKNDNLLIEFIFNNILTDLNYEVLLKWLEKLKEENMDSYIKRILINNKSIISEDNYKELFRYDENLKYIVGGGHKIDKSYLPIIEIMLQKNIIKSPTNRGDNYYIYFKSVKGSK